jgi:hypothetical protein
MMIFPGLNIMPWEVFGFIDDSIDCISIPFSGLRGDYKSAASRVKYANVQQAFYSGYVKDHGIMVETIYMTNGLLTLFGPVSAHRADAGVLAMSNFNKFLLQLQTGRFVTLSGAEVIYSGFDDFAFNLGLHYKEFHCGAMLNGAQAMCNEGMRSAKTSIEKNHGMVSNLFRICCTTKGVKITIRNGLMPNIMGYKFIAYLCP